MKRKNTTTNIILYRWNSVRQRSDNGMEFSLLSTIYIPNKLSNTAIIIIFDIITNIRLIGNVENKNNRKNVTILYKLLLELKMPFIKPM